MRKNHNQRGFTIVEIAIVFVIVMLMAVIAIPAFTRMREKEQLTNVGGEEAKKIAVQKLGADPSSVHVEVAGRSEEGTKFLVSYKSSDPNDSGEYEAIVLNGDVIMTSTWKPFPKEDIAEDLKK